MLGYPVPAQVCPAESDHSKETIWAWGATSIVWYFTPNPEVNKRSDLLPAQGHSRTESRAEQGRAGQGNEIDKGYCINISEWV